MPDFLNPLKILEELELQDNMTAADFGCGSGGWTLPLAEKLDQGKVYALDVLPEPLSALKNKAKSWKLINIETRLADLEKRAPLPDESCDLVLMTNLLFECDDKKAVLREGKRVLKPGGRLLVVDWIKDNPLAKEIEFLSFEEIKNYAHELGLKLEKEFPAGSYHHALVLVK